MNVNHLWSFWKRAIYAIEYFNRRIYCFHTYIQQTTISSLENKLIILLKYNLFSIISFIIIDLGIRKKEQLNQADNYINHLFPPITTKKREWTHFQRKTPIEETPVTWMNLDQKKFKPYLTLLARKTTHVRIAK